MENSLLILMNDSVELARIKPDEIKELQTIEECHIVKISVIGNSKKEYYILRENHIDFLGVLNSIKHWKMAAKHRVLWCDSFYIPNELTLDILSPLRTFFEAPSKFLCLIDGGWEKLIPVEIITEYAHSNTLSTLGEFTLIIQTKIGDHKIVRTDRSEFLKILGAFQNWFGDSKNTEMLRIFQKSTNKILQIKSIAGTRPINIEEIERIEIITSKRTLIVHLKHQKLEIKRQTPKSFDTLLENYLAWKNSLRIDEILVIDEVEKTPIIKELILNNLISLGDEIRIPHQEFISVEIIERTASSQSTLDYYSLSIRSKDLRYPNEYIIRRKSYAEIYALLSSIVNWNLNNKKEALIIKVRSDLEFLAENHIATISDAYKKEDYDKMVYADLINRDQFKEDTFKIKSFLGLKKEDFKDVIVSLSEVPVTGIASTDDVNHPDHYKTGGIETIDYMKAKSTPEEFRGYLKNCVLKYVSRANYKGDARKDLAKAKWYLDYLLKEIEEHEKRLDNAVEKTKRQIAAIEGIPYKWDVAVLQDFKRF